MNSRAQAPLRTCGSQGAQGTIEYLVILGIVVVLSLVVVGFSTGILSSNSIQVGYNSNQISNKVGVDGISVTEAVADSSGNALISLRNVAAGNVTLSKITPINSNGTEGTANNYNTLIAQGNTTTFSLSDINSSCPCNPNSPTKTCKFQITINTDTGLQKALTTIITTNCSPVITPNNPSSVVGLGSGTLADPWVINSCTELQHMSQRKDGNYILGVDLNCAETRTWNSNLGFEPIGTAESCSDSRCSDQSSCELPYGCASTWLTQDQCGWNMMICTWSQSNCENLCHGDWNATAYTCTGTNYTPVYCNDSQSICETYCYNTWMYANSCRYYPTCTTQVTCERTFGCGSTWNKTSFLGSLNGNNKTISNLFINRGSTDYVSLLGNTSGASAFNFSLTGVDINGASYVGSVTGNDTSSTFSNITVTGKVGGSSSVGGIVGQTNSASSFSNISFDGNVTGTGSNVGGFVGVQSSGTITSSRSTGTVTSTSSNVGGFAGYITSGTITNCGSDSNVTGNSNGYAGGFVGQTGASSVIKNSYATGSVYASSTYASSGGFTAWNNGQIFNSYATGKVTGNWRQGGFVGTSYTGALIENSYATGSVTGVNGSGGFLGDGYGGTLKNCFSTGLVTSTGDKGGFIGYKYLAAVTNSHFDQNKANQACCWSNSCASGCGIQNVNNVAPTYFYVSSNAPLSSWTFGTDKNWNICSGQGYPWLAWENRTC